MLHLILSPGVRANDLRSQCKAAGEELKLCRLQERRRLRGDGKHVALLLHLGQEGRHLRQGLQAQLVKTQELESNPEKKTWQKHKTALYLGSLLLLHYCKGYGFWVRLTARLSTRQRRRGGRSVRRAAADKLERLIQDGQSVVAAVGHGGGRAYALAQAIPGVFHDAKRAQRQTCKRPRGFSGSEVCVLQGFFYTLIHLVLIDKLF